MKPGDQTAYGVVTDVDYATYDIRDAFLVKIDEAKVLRGFTVLDPETGELRYIPLKSGTTT